MKKIHFLIVLFCISQIGFSQTDFRPGFIISQSQDTTFGLIRYKEGSTSNHSCQFKASATQDITTYKADDITGYGFKNDKVFKSQKIETSDQNSETVFLEILISGKLTLYKYENIFYVEKADQGLKKLSNKTMQTVDGKEMEVESKTYLGLLSLLLSDSPEMKQERIYRTTFNEKSLTELIGSYNKSMNSTQVIYKNGKPWIHARVGVAAGLISSQLSLIADNQSLFHLGPFERIQSPIYAATLEIQSPRINERISVIMDFMLTESKYNSFNQYELGGTTTKNTVTIDMTHLKVPLGLRYTFKGKGLSAYINAGISDNFNIKAQSLWKQNVQHSTLVYNYEKEALDICKSQLGVWGGVGFNIAIGKVMNVFAEARYEKQQGINSYNYTELKRSDVTDFQILIGLTTK